MNAQDVTETTVSTARRACLVAGCTCKDARIVSTRRTSYFASVARVRHETADRVVAPDDDWRLPVSPALDAARALAAAITAPGAPGAGA